MANELRNFLALSYDELEQLNLQAKEQRKNRVAAHKIQEDRLKYLTDEKRIKAVTVLFSDLEGRLHMLDYDKKFLIKSWDNLTFDGSSIRGPIKCQVVPALYQELLVIVQHVEAAFEVAEEDGYGLNAFFVGKILDALFLNFVRRNAVLALLFG